jgi:hypothetical protein
MIEAPVEQNRGSASTKLARRPVIVAAPDRVGRVQRACWRALIAAGKPLTTSALMAWAPGVFRHSVRRAAYRFAVSAGRHGNEAVWRLK